MSPQSLRSAPPVARSTPPDLADTSKFILIDRVPILDEHLRTRRGEDGSPVTEYVSPDQLAVIAENSKRRADSGDLGLVFIGHTDRDKPEIEQPPLVGYMRNHRMGVDSRNRPVILADLYIDREYESLVSKFPRRSVEIFGKTTPHGYIDSLALLKRAPERDLGLVTYSRRSGIERCECQATQSRGGLMATPRNGSVDKVRRYLAGRTAESRSSGKPNPANQRAIQQLANSATSIRADQNRLASDLSNLKQSTQSLRTRVDGLHKWRAADQARTAMERRRPMIEALAEQYHIADPERMLEKYSSSSDEDWSDALAEIERHYVRRPGVPATFFDPLADEPIDSRELQHYIRDQNITVRTPEDAARAVERYIASKKAANIR